MALRKIGEGVTDINGNCIIPYTGAGVGMLQMRGQYEEDERVILSETYDVLDCYRYDSGTDPNNNIWGIGYGTLTRGTEYSTLKESATNDGIIAISNIPLTDYHIEVDIMQVDGTANRNILQILNNDYSPVTGGYRDGALGEWKHFDIDFNDLAVNTRVRLITSNDCTELRFKNFKLYPI